MPDQTDPAKLYWALVLNQHAAALSTIPPYDTLRLVATPRNDRGGVLAGLPSPQFSSGDPELVVVTPEGLVTAVGHTASPVWVYATLTANNLKHVDSALINVIADTPPTVASLSIRPIPPDSAKISARAVLPQPFDTIPIRVRDRDSTLLPIVLRDVDGVIPVAVRSSDTNTAILPSRDVIGAPIGLGVLRGMRPGSVTLYASTMAFGVELADTLAYRVGMPVLGFFNITRDSMARRYTLFTPEMTIGVGGAVTWLTNTASGDSLDVTFEDADTSSIRAIEPALEQLSTFGVFVSSYYCFNAGDQCAKGGNMLVGPGPLRPAVGRYFPVPGIYNFHSVAGGFSGRVVVVDER